MKLSIDPDIRSASTLPGSFYGDPRVHSEVVERVFARTWQLVSHARALEEPSVVPSRTTARAIPLTMLEGSLDEPLVLTRDRQGAVRCLSNVCTHRGNLVVNEPCATETLRCRYHGRRFGLDGRFAFMPEFEAAIGFPSSRDDLPEVPFARLGPLFFASLDPAHSFDDLIAPARSRIELGGDRLTLDPDASHDYDVAANWALYCDNYLEGFHIPFVHAGLAELLDYGAYETETFPYGSVQIGSAKAGEPAFELPASHPDHAKRVAAYYVWLFPATMINVYPWGLSVNAVRPLGPTRTRVSFLTFVGDETKRGQGAGADLQRVELEDEAVVESVQRGVRSRLYRSGRLSPAREQGVHHFHRLLASFLADSAT